MHSQKEWVHYRDPPEKSVQNLLFAALFSACMCQPGLLRTVVDGWWGAGAGAGAGGGMLWLESGSERSLAWATERQSVECEGYDRSR